MGDFSNSISNECSGCITAVWLQPCGVFAANVTEHSREPLHKSSTHVLAHACRVRQHPGLCSNLILA